MSVFKSGFDAHGVRAVRHHSFERKKEVEARDRECQVRYKAIVCVCVCV